MTCTQTVSPVKSPIFAFFASLRLPPLFSRLFCGRKRNNLRPARSVLRPSRMRAWRGCDALVNRPSRHWYHRPHDRAGRAGDDSVRLPRCPTPSPHSPRMKQSRPLRRRSDAGAALGPRSGANVAGRRGSVKARLTSEPFENKNRGCGRHNHGRDFLPAQFARRRAVAANERSEGVRVPDKWWRG